MKKDSEVIRLKIIKRTYSLIAKNKPDRNCRLRITENRQNMYSKFEFVKNKKVKSEYTKQNMTVVKKSLKSLEEEELTAEVRKYPVLYGKSHKEYMEKDALNNA